MNKEEFLRSLHTVYCRLAPTAHGVGVIAVRTIPKGANPFVGCDRHGETILISEHELNESDAPEEVKGMVRDYYVLKGGSYHVSTEGVDAVDKSYFVNHSDTPNLKCLLDGEIFVALRDIAAGEELTVDYNTYDEARAPIRRED